MAKDHSEKEQKAKEESKPADLQDNTGGEVTKAEKAAVTEQTKKIIGQLSKKAGEREELTMSRSGEGFGAELGSLDFRNMIGGPLQAAIDAQVASSIASVDFIKKVGFNEDGTIVNVQFKKTATTTPQPTEDNPNPAATTENREISVPLLACLNIPFLRIEYVDIDFNVKLNSVDTASSSQSLGINAEASGGFGPVRFKVSASYQRQSSTGTEVKREYSMNVKVRAVQDEMPKGIEQVLNLLQ
ncbi:DUF2589 domain-containing protein [Runella sp.]|uniref:DUF2589 domain-containing protein n=1 Tax=Runella sp. TaxID=1960881 RepID=UPI003D0A5B24